MSKTSIFTTITPLPAGITRQSVLETYRNHVEMIELNPLVVERFNCKPPQYAPAEEYYSTWYTIKDKVAYLPGGLATGSVSYHACFHDLPDGLQTHVYAPLGLDIRAKWSVGGSLPGEPKKPVELGIGAPREGLYIREDVRMRCNIMMMSFVKKTFKESHAKLVDRLMEKAHVLESNIANERLKALRAVDPGERMGHGDIFIAPPPDYEYETPVPLAVDQRSRYSNGSNQSQMTSPGLSHSSTLTSRSGFPASPVYEPPYEQSDRGSFQRASFHGFQPVEKSEPTLAFLPATTYDPNQLPPTTYDPRQKQYPLEHKRSRSASPYASYREGAMELPAEAPPVPPKDERKFYVELPA